MDSGYWDGQLYYICRGRSGWQALKETCGALRGGLGRTDGHGRKYGGRTVVERDFIGEPTWMDLSTRSDRIGPIEQPSSYSSASSQRPNLRETDILPRA